MYLKENIKLLRKRRKRSQEEVAKSLSITRSAYNSYENGVAEPGITLLLRLADFYQVNLDKLVKVDLSTLPESQLSQLEKGFDLDLNGTRLRVLTTTVNTNNEENVELVPLKAKAGYTTGYADPDFISVLPAFNLPFLSPNRKYRTFPISGDSMPPVMDGAWVTGEYLQDWNQVRNGNPYIVVTQDEGIVFKVLYNRVDEDGTFLHCSTNPLYEPYAVKVNDILEIWKFVNYINPKFEEPVQGSQEDVGPALRVIQREIGFIKEKVKSIEHKI
ncbi:MAG: helix-turn-helix domain-containing protein [Bacteroidetes bacterium]|nr:helix-turn-helix domain-containing protein [Bacteroidota bacterium]